LRTRENFCFFFVFCCDKKTQKFPPGGGGGGERGTIFPGDGPGVSGGAAIGGPNFQGLPGGGPKKKKR